MSIFKRLTASFSATVDQMVSNIENHDAVVEAALRDAKQSLSKAKVRLNRLREERERMQTRAQQLAEAEKQWTDRAKRSASGDEDTALACLRKRRQCVEQIAALNDAVARQLQLENRVAADIAAGEARVQTITQKRNLLRTRESAAEAMAAIAKLEPTGTVNIDDTFERWEVRISNNEFAPATTDPLTDTLEQQFLQAEEQESLRAELARLTKENTDEQR